MARPVFLSYAWEDAELADRIEGLLRLRGVPVWRDRRDMRWGAYSEDVVIDAIERRCSGFVLLLTDAAMKSDFIHDIELPAMSRRRSADAQFFAGAVFARTLGITESASELRQSSGVELGSALGSPISDEDLSADLRRAAIAVLESYLRTATANGQEASARLETRGSIPEEEPSTLHLAWSPPLHADLDDHQELVWVEDLLPALSDLRGALEATGTARELLVEGRPHLSAALALGHEFRAPTGWTLGLRQEALHVQTARGEPEPGGWSFVREPSASGDDHRLVLCLHATKDVSRAMAEHCRNLPPARLQLHVRPSGEPGHHSVRSDDINGLCASIESSIAQARSRYGVGETHLYLACPWVLAAALGWHLSSAGRLVAHEADVARSSYRAACHLA